MASAVLSSPPLGLGFRKCWNRTPAGLASPPPCTGPAVLIASAQLASPPPSHAPVRLDYEAQVRNRRSIFRVQGFVRNSSPATHRSGSSQTMSTSPSMRCAVRYLTTAAHRPRDHDLSPSEYLHSACNQPHGFDCLLCAVPTPTTARY